jgi:zona occludens toxin (predicted ATPase)
MALKLAQGVKGSGKTSLVTKIAYDAYKKGRKIFCNYTLKFPYNKINLAELLSSSNQLQDAVLIIDEAQLYFDCRLSYQKANRLFSYIALQSRKRNLDVILTSQQVDNVDIRVRRNLDTLFTCYAYKFGMVKGKKKLVPCTVEDTEDRIVDRILVYEANLAQNAYAKFLFNPHPYFAMYNSDEFMSLE